MTPNTVIKLLLQQEREREREREGWRESERVIMEFLVDESTMLGRVISLGGLGSSAILLCPVEIRVICEEENYTVIVLRRSRPGRATLQHIVATEAGVSTTHPVDLPPNTKQRRGQRAKRATTHVARLELGLFSLPREEVSWLG